MYHYNIGIFTDYKNFNNRMNKENIFGISNSETMQKFNDSISKKIIFIEAGSEFTDTNKTIPNYLLSNYHLISKKDFYQIYSVYEFEKK